MGKRIGFTACILIALMMGAAGHFFSEGGNGGCSRFGEVFLGAVHVNVTLENGYPAPDMTVYVHRYDDLPYFGASGITDASGSVEIEPTSNNLGPCYVTVANATEALWTRAEAYIEPLKMNYVNVVLGRGLNYDNVIIGTVTNISSGTPIAGVPIVLRGIDLYGREVIFEKVSGAGGDYSFSVPYTDKYYNMWTYGGETRGTMEYSRTVILNRSVTFYPIDIGLRPIVVGKPLNIRFTDEATGEPLKDTYASIYGLAGFLDHIPWSDSLSYMQPSGWFNVSAGKGEYVVELFKTANIGDGAITTITHMGVIMDDSPITMEVRLPSRTVFRNVTVTVLESGTMVPVKHMALGTSKISQAWSGGFLETSSFVSTGPTGTAVLPVVPERDMMLSVAASYFYLPSEILLEAGPAGDDPKVTIYLDKDPSYEPFKTGNISILVKDERSGAVMPGANIYGTNPNIQFQSFSETANEFGYLNMSVKAGQYTSVTVTSSLGSGEITDFEVEPGKKTTRTLYITQRRDFVRSNSVEFSFRLTDPQGNPLPNFPFSVLKKMGEGYYSGNIGTSSDDDGWARVTIPPGDYVLMDPFYFDGIAQTRNHWAFVKDVPITVPVSGGIGPDVIAYSSYPLTTFTGDVKVRTTDAIIPGSEILYSSGQDIEMTTRAEFTDIRPYSVRYLMSRMTSDLSGGFRMWGKDSIRYICSAPGFYPRSGTVDVSSGPVSNDIYLEPLKHSSLFLNGTILDYMDLPVKGRVEIYDLDKELYKVNSTKTLQDGMFSFGAYPGRFEIKYGNDTYMESMVLEVTLSINDLVLRVIPECIVEGFVVDGEGGVQPDISVVMVTDGFEPIVSTSDVSGYYRFDAVPGTCRLAVAESEEYDAFLGEAFTAPPLGYVFQNITLKARSSGVISGYVYGDRAGTTEIIFGCHVTLKDAMNATLFETRTGMDGSFEIGPIVYGTDYMLWADPPGDLAADIGGKRSGYLPGSYGPFDMVGRAFTGDILLEFIEFPSEGYYNITGYSPTGSDVFLNEPIIVTFSSPMDALTLEGNLTVDPHLTNMTAEWSEDGITLVLGHSGFVPNTTYTVTISGSIRSIDGYTLYGASYRRWNFTTGTEKLTWWLDSRNVDVSPDRTVNVSVTGEMHIAVFFIVDGLGSFLLAEGPDGTFTGSIGGTLLDWDRSYDYHFSDVENGSDKAPIFSGSFRTPVESVVWGILSASVGLDTEGNCIAEAGAVPDLEIWIVIKDIGSFVLTESTPEDYKTTVPADEFEPGVEYSYWFSDSKDGSDKASAFAGKFKTKEVSTEKATDEDNWWIWLVPVALLFLILLIMAAVISFVLSRRGRSDTNERSEE